METLAAIVLVVSAVILGVGGLRMALKAIEDVENYVSPYETTIYNTPRLEKEPEKDKYEIETELTKEEKEELNNYMKDFEL